MANFVSDFISGVFRVFNTERDVNVKGALRGGFGVTVLMDWGRVVRGMMGGMMRGGVGSVWRQ